jgi:hypothetical protein
MRQADQLLVAQFKKIAVGMSPTEVREIMHQLPMRRTRLSNPCCSMWQGDNGPRITKHIEANNHGVG